MSPSCLSEKINCERESEVLMAGQARFMVLFAMAVLLVAMAGAEASSHRCNMASYNPIDHYAASVAYVLQDLQAVTPSRQGYDYRNTAPYYDAPCYGHATCSASLAADACAFCLNAAAKLVADSCGRTVGAEGDLDSCSIRYEQYPF